MCYGTDGLTDKIIETKTSAYIHITYVLYVYSVNYKKKKNSSEEQEQASKLFIITKLTQLKNDCNYC